MSLASCEFCPEKCISKSDGGTILYKGTYCSCFRMKDPIKRYYKKDYLVKRVVPSKHDRNVWECVQYFGITTDEYKKLREAYKKDIRKFLNTKA